MIRSCRSEDQAVSSTAGRKESGPEHIARVDQASQAIPAGPTREQLFLRARQLDIRGRSGMSKEELQHAVEQAEAHRLKTMSLADLRDCAHAFDIEGRSKMTREELVRAVRDVRCQCPVGRG